MTAEEKHELLEEFHQQCNAISNNKQKDYAGRNVDILANFKRNAERLGLTPFQILMVYWGKHLDSIWNAIKTNPEYPQVETEPFIERLKDSYNYNRLLYLLFVEKQWQLADQQLQCTDSPIKLRNSTTPSPYQPTPHPDYQNGNEGSCVND